MIDEGRITEDEAATHPQRSLLLKALTGHEVEPSLTIREARPGDRYLICSDGLSGMVTDDSIAQIASGAKSLERAVAELVDAANRNGGTDNVTTLLLQCLAA